MERPLNILLIEDDPAHARLVQEAVVSSSLSRIHWVQSIDDALSELDDIDVVLLDLGLGPTNGVETLVEFRNHNTRTPVVIHSSQADMQTAIEAMRRGAQEYLVKGTFEHTALHRACRYAIERKKMQEFEQLLVGVVGHDLRTPLQVIASGADLCLRDDGLSDMSRSAVQKVARAGVRCQRLVADLLDVTLMRAKGQLSFEIETAEVREIVSQVVRDIRDLYPDREISFEVESTCPATCDPARIEQAVTNLLTNALQHGSEDGTVDVRVGEVDNWVAIAIRNTGTQIDPQQMAALFQPLETGDRHHPNSSSFGLGLYIVSLIVDGHDGRLDVTSDEDATTFQIRLPAAKT